MNEFLIVSFYTPNYRRYAKKLEASIIKVNSTRDERLPALKYEIHKIPPRSWEVATALKARFIFNRLMVQSRDVVWIDADAILHKYPSLFLDIQCDFAAHLRTWRHIKNELLSGTLYFKNTARVHSLVRQWMNRCKNQPNEWDQIHLRTALDLNDTVFFERLPIEYCTIFDDQNRKKINPVIEHFQASRKVRRGEL